MIQLSGGYRCLRYRLNLVEVLLDGPPPQRLAASLWLTAAASPHTSSSFALLAFRVGTVNGHRSRARCAPAWDGFVTSCHLACHLAVWPLHVHPPTPHAPAGVEGPPHPRLPPWPRQSRAPCSTLPPRPLLLLHYTAVKEKRNYFSTHKTERESRKGRRETERQRQRQKEKEKEKEKETEKALGARPSSSPVACFGRSGLLAVLTYGSRYVANTVCGHETC